MSKNNLQWIFQKIRQIFIDFFKDEDAETLVRLEVYPKSRKTFKMTRESWLLIFIVLLIIVLILLFIFRTASQDALVQKTAEGWNNGHGDDGNQSPEDRQNKEDGDEEFILVSNDLLISGHLYSLERA